MVDPSSLGTPFERTTDNARSCILNALSVAMSSRVIGHLLVLVFPLLQFRFFNPLHAQLGCLKARAYSRDGQHAIPIGTGGDNSRYQLGDYVVRGRSIISIIALPPFDSSHLDDDG